MSTDLTTDDERELEAGAAVALRLPLHDRPALLAALRRAGVAADPDEAGLAAWSACRVALQGRAA